MPASVPKLRVHDVGNFDASFVPRIDDFDRLDERFRIPRAVWEELPTYRDYGFAVFKLKAAALGLRGLAHPMAFEFPRRNPDLLYFPTVHVHDRQIHQRAEFDHMLYCQADTKTGNYLEGWEQSNGRAEGFMWPKTQGIVQGTHVCWRRPLTGMIENKDTEVGLGGIVPKALPV